MSANHIPAAVQAAAAALRKMRGCNPLGELCNWKVFSDETTERGGVHVQSVKVALWFSGWGNQSRTTVVLERYHTAHSKGCFVVMNESRMSDVDVLEWILQYDGQQAGWYPGLRKTRSQLRREAQLRGLVIKAREHYRLPQKEVVRFDRD